MRRRQSTRNLFGAPGERKEETEKKVVVVVVVVGKGKKRQM
jgi:hypothetical protein